MNRRRNWFAGRAIPLLPAGCLITGSRNQPCQPLRSNGTASSQWQYPGGSPGLSRVNPSIVPCNCGEAGVSVRRVSLTQSENAANPEAGLCCQGRDTIVLGVPCIEEKQGYSFSDTVGKHSQSGGRAQPIRTRLPVRSCRRCRGIPLRDPHNPSGEYCLCGTKFPALEAANA